MGKKIELEAGEQIVMEEKANIDWQGEGMKEAQYTLGVMTVTNKRVAFRDDSADTNVNLDFYMEEIAGVSLQTTMLVMKALVISLKEDKYKAGKDLVFRVGKAMGKPGAPEVKAAIEKQMK